MRRRMAPSGLHFTRPKRSQSQVVSCKIFCPLSPTFSPPAHTQTPSCFSFSFYFCSYFSFSCSSCRPGPCLSISFHFISPFPFLHLQYKSSARASLLASLQARRLLRLIKWHPRQRFTIQNDLGPARWVGPHHSRTLLPATLPTGGSSRPTIGRNNRHKLKLNNGPNGEPKKAGAPPETAATLITLSRGRAPSAQGNNWPDCVRVLPGEAQMIQSSRTYRAHLAPMHNAPPRTTFGAPIWPAQKRSLARSNGPKKWPASQTGGHFFGLQAALSQEEDCVRLAVRRARPPCRNG